MNFGYPAQITTSRSRREGDTANSYYRVVDDSVGEFDMDGDLIRSYPKLKIIEYPVVRYTPKGASIRTGDSGAHETRFVSGFTRKRFAWATREQALADYIKRKTMQASIMRQRAMRCEQYIKMAEYELRSYQPPEEVRPSCSDAATRSPSTALTS